MSEDLGPLLPAVSGWKALLQDESNDGSYVAPIVAWAIRSDHLTPVCATCDPPGYPRIPSESELFAVFEPGHEMDEADFQAAAEERAEARKWEEMRERKEHAVRIAGEGAE